MIRTDLKHISLLMFAVVIFVTHHSASAQRDSLLTEKPLVVVDTSRQHSPRLATILSAALPGAGQFYNRKYWKIPVIYALGGGLIYSLHHNNKNYHQFRRAYTQFHNSGEPVSGFEMYSKEQLKIIKDQYRRNRDLSIIGITLLYVLNIVDASVDAHLFDYDIGDDLSLKVQPNFMINQWDGQGQLALNFSLQF